jgi:hypothetical protein
VPLFGRLGCRAGAFCFCFLLGCVALRLSFVLLGLALAVHIIAAYDGTDDFLGLALDSFDDAFDGFFGTAVLIRHFGGARSIESLATVPG